MTREHGRFVGILGAVTALVPLSIDMYLPALPALGLLIVVVLLTQFDVRAYGIAAAALAIAFIVQTIPWKPGVVPGESPP